MSEAPGDRFRRLVRVWREQQQPSSPVETFAPPALALASQPAPASVEPVQPVRADVIKPQPVAVSPPTVSIEKIMPVVPPVELSALDPDPGPDEFKTPTEARRFLERLRAKTTQVVQDFTDGAINQRQFEAIYAHYQRQRMAVEKALIEMPGSGAWRAAAVEGHTMFLHQQHAATVLGYAIYETSTWRTLAQVGEVNLDLSMLPALTERKDAAQDVHFIEGLAVVQGRFSTLVAIFTAEPATLQLQMIQDLHRDFEMVTEMHLSSDDVEQLAHTFTSLWAFEQELPEV